MTYVHHEMITTIKEKNNFFPCNENSLDLLSQQLSYIMYSSVNYIYLVVSVQSLSGGYIPISYLSYYWKFVMFDHLHSMPLSPNPTSGDHKSDPFFYKLFLFFLQYDRLTTLYYFLVHNTVIWYFFTFQNAYHGKSSYHLSPYKDFA